MLRPDISDISGHFRTDRRPFTFPSRAAANLNHGEVGVGGRDMKWKRRLLIFLTALALALAAALGSAS